MGRRGSSTEDTRTKLLNSLGMFQRELLESYHSNNETTGCNTKKKKNNRHVVNIGGHGNGDDDTDRFHPIRPQHTRRFSDMPSSTAVNGDPHHQRHQYNKSLSSSATTRSALRNTVSFETTLNDIVVLADDDDDDDVEAGGGPSPQPPPSRNPWHSPFWKGNDDGDGDDHDYSIQDSTRSHTTNTTVDSHTTMTETGNGDNNNNNNDDNNNYGVRFLTVVTGVQIPSRNQYSNRIKSSMWRSKDEINQMVERNLAQFQYENYDWRSVVEETDFLVKDGERIHPCQYDLDDDANDKTNGINDDAAEDVANYLAAMEVKTDNTESEAVSADDNYDDDDYDDDHVFLPLRRNVSVSRI